MDAATLLWAIIMVKNLPDSASAAAMDAAQDAAASAAEAATHAYGISIESIDTDTKRLAITEPEEE